ncbi:DgyrCDS14788 [Dimorphilus gyrociliatus]|uniref:DgyrCDS14788 n=1 Tax=Dimorphilus gyrociliatus TaxID=2664684 RepID=A0A7I8WF93_9ANNE|nr:DgyrCDS14788 [Dimorphilus gyrociliatus]
MRPQYFSCKKTINKQKKGKCSLCKHTNHWICLQDNLYALCVSIQNCQAKIVLRRCDKKEFEAKQIVSDNEMIDSLITSDGMADENHPQEDLGDHQIVKYFCTNKPVAIDITVVDVEGFHNRLNLNVGNSKSFYHLLDELKREADLVPVIQKMLCKKKLKHYQKRFM